MADHTLSKPISIAIAAMGGQGGGVLSGWIVELAESNGYYAQSTSVPGVAQRTGATVNYIEMIPEPAVESNGAPPVLALMPIPGDVDIVIAAELVEAGRAIQRGIVTPDQTTLIASSHRFYAISEKSAMSDGRVDSTSILNACEAAARNFHCFDMQDIASTHGTVISAVLFGALAASNALPFEISAFEKTVRDDGIAVETSLAGFQAGLERALAAEPGTGEIKEDSQSRESVDLHPEIVDLLERIRTEFPPESCKILREGIRRLIDYQDTAYAHTYLDQLVGILDAAGSNQSVDPELVTVAGRHLALWMSYEDTIRVADLKTRSARFSRCREAAGAEPGQIVRLTEFMHPRVEEICDTLPHWLGGAIIGNRFLKAGAHRLLGHPWKIRTSSLWGFILLYSLARMKIMRRRSYRFRRESANIAAWLGRICAAVSGRRPNLAIEIALCQRLIKGYGDTFERGWSSFSDIMKEIDRTGIEEISPERVATLREAALADEDGAALREELLKVA